MIVSKFANYYFGLTTGGTCIRDVRRRPLRFEGKHLLLLRGEKFSCTRRGSIVRPKILRQYFDASFDVVAELERVVR